VSTQRMDASEVSTRVLALADGAAGLLNVRYAGV
jgi:hypothetical protein